MRRLSGTVILPLLLAGCAARPAEMPQMACPHLPPDPVAVHAAAKPPVSDRRLVLRPAHWEWADGGYVWEQPAWVVPPWPSASLWQNGFWTPNGGGCAWTTGHFVL